MGVKILYLGVYRKVKADGGRIGNGQPMAAFMVVRD